MSADDSINDPLTPKILPRRLAFKQDFKKQNRDAIEELRARAADQSRLSPGDAARMYFSWKAATDRESTIARQKRSSDKIEKFIGASIQLRRIDLELIRESAGTP